jgi:hypothetical protein
MRYGYFSPKTKSGAGFCQKNKGKKALVLNIHIVQEWSIFTANFGAPLDKIALLR